MYISIRKSELYSLSIKDRLHLKLLKTRAVQGTFYFITSLQKKLRGFMGKNAPDMSMSLDKNRFVERGMKIPGSGA